jgi:hypothetical protein
MNEIKILMRLTNTMINVADKIDLKRCKPSIHMLAGVVRDCAYKIREKVEEAKVSMEVYGE